MVANLRNTLTIHQKFLITTLAFTVLFWQIFDSCLSYITPLLIESRGFSPSTIGLIIGSSSIAGAIFDFFIAKIFTRLHFRRIFLLMFALCLIYPLLLWGATTLSLFLLAMAVWGIYYDLYGIGSMNFISKYIDKKFRASSFGLIQMARSLGFIIGPLVIGLVILDKINWLSLGISWVFLGIGFIFFIILSLILPTEDKITAAKKDIQIKSIWTELKLWENLGKKLSPALIVTCYFFIIESAFWTIGPLYGIESADGYGKFLITIYQIPALIVGWFIGSVVNKYGNRSTAFVSLLIGAAILSSFVFMPTPFLVLAVTFIASIFICASLPAINTEYANFIAKTPKRENEVSGLEDFSFNIGYVIGPIAAGILADALSIPHAFSILGGLGIIIALILLITSNAKKLHAKTN